MVNKYLLSLVLASLCLTGCNEAFQKEVADAKTKVDRLEARQVKLQEVVSRYETLRDSTRDEIARLRVLKGGLEDDGTNNIVTITNQPITQIVVVTNQIIVVTNQVVTQTISTFESAGDGRLNEKRQVMDTFKTADVFVLPYSPHEFIVRSNSNVFYVYRDTIGIGSFLLFK